MAWPSLPSTQPPSGRAAEAWDESRTALFTAAGACTPAGGRRALHVCSECPLYAQRPTVCTECLLCAQRLWAEYRAASRWALHCSFWSSRWHS